MSSYRNQSIDLLCKSIDWFLYGGALAFNELRPIFSMSPLMHNVEKCSNMLINFAVITRICLVIFQHNAWKGWIEIIQLIYTHINISIDWYLSYWSKDFVIVKAITPNFTILLWLSNTFPRCLFLIKHCKKHSWKKIMSLSCKITFPELRWYNLWFL